MSGRGITKFSTTSQHKKKMMNDDVGRFGDRQTTKRQWWRRRTSLKMSSLLNRKEWHVHNSLFDLWIEEKFFRKTSVSLFVKLTIEKIKKNVLKTKNWNNLCQKNCVVQSLNKWKQPIESTCNMAGCCLWQLILFFEFCFLFFFNGPIVGLKVFSLLLSTFWNIYFNWGLCREYKMR